MWECVNACVHCSLVSIVAVASPRLGLLIWQVPAASALDTKARGDIPYSQMLLRWWSLHTRRNRHG